MTRTPVFGVLLKLLGKFSGSAAKCAPTAMTSSVEEIRDQWRGNGRTTLPWVLDIAGPQPQPGECKGEMYTAPGFPRRAYVKPGNIGKIEWETQLPLLNRHGQPVLGANGQPSAVKVKWPVAAYEKIAADLAHDLDLPVPAAQVWERNGPNLPSGYPAHSVASLEEYPQALPWPVVTVMLQAGAPTIAGFMGVVSLAQASGMVVFDTWTEQEDRGLHPGNVLYGYDPAEPARSRLFFLDFGRTMNWRGTWEKGGWHDVRVCPEPPQLLQVLDRRVVGRTLAAIEHMPQDTIIDTCRRLTGPHFTKAQAALLSEGLIGRRKLLRPVLQAANLL